MHAHHLDDYYALNLHMSQLNSLAKYLSCLKLSLENCETEGGGHLVIYHDRLNYLAAMT